VARGNTVVLQMASYRPTRVLFRLFILTKSNDWVAAAAGTGKKQRQELAEVLATIAEGPPCDPFDQDGFQRR